MTVISSNPDRENLEFTVVAEFDATPEQVWEVWEDPRKLEKWWGPPTWPATFNRHEFEEGGEARYFMTGPEGNKAHGYWRFKTIDQFKSIQIQDGFADENGEPTDEMPTMDMRMTLENEGGRTRMATRTSFQSIEDLDKVLEMGMEEGMKQAMGQIDSLL